VVISSCSKGSMSRKGCFTIKFKKKTWSFTIFWDTYWSPNSDNVNVHLPIQPYENDHESIYFN